MCRLKSSAVPRCSVAAREILPALPPGLAPCVRDIAGDAWPPRLPATTRGRSGGIILQAGGAPLGGRLDRSGRWPNNLRMLNIFRSTVYVRIKPDRLSVLHVESGVEHADVPTLAIEQAGGRHSVIAVGREAAGKAGLPNVTLANGFEHPRTLIADFSVAEQTLRQFLRRVLPRSLFAVSPIVVIHPQARLEGGLTQVEIRAFAELGIGAGARKIFVWQGPDLSTEELRELRFSRIGGRLLHPQDAG